MSERCEVKVIQRSRDINVIPFHFRYEPQSYVSSLFCKKRKREEFDIGRKREYVQLPNYFSYLPPEIIKWIFNFLDIKSLGKSTTVCWLWSILSSDEQVWLCQYHSVWKNRPECDPYIKAHPLSWRQLSLNRRSIETEYFFGPNPHKAPSDSQVFLMWGDFLSKEAINISRIDRNKADWLFFIAMQEYDSAVSLDTGCYSALIHWGDVLSDVALTKLGSEREELFRISREKFETAKLFIPEIHNLKFGSVDISLFGYHYT